MADLFINWPFSFRIGMWLWHGAVAVAPPSTPLRPSVRQFTFKTIGDRYSVDNPAECAESEPPRNPFSSGFFRTLIRTSAIPQFPGKIR